MKLAFRVEVQPTPTQRRALAQHAGCSRWAYNWGLARKKEAWVARKAALDSDVPKQEAPRVPTAVDLHRELVVLKQTPAEGGGVPWMYESSKCAPQEALRDLDVAFRRFFGRGQAKRSGHPRFKSKKRGLGGFRLTGVIRADANTVTLPRLGRLRVKPGDHGYVPQKAYGQASVTERAGRWYVSVLGPDVDEARPNEGPTVGVDLGVVRLATLSDGAVFENPRALARAERKLRRRQRALSRKQKGSRRRQKARLAVARAWRRVVNVRRDALHQATTAIAKRYGRAALEDLRVANMTRRCRGRGRAAKAGLNRAVLDAGFAEFRRLLEYKGRLHGCEVVVVPAAYTSQRCSRCGHTEAANRPSQAVFRCVSCGHAEHADLNAAKNILVAGSCLETVNASGAGVRRRPVRAGAVCVEAGIGTVTHDSDCT